MDRTTNGCLTATVAIRVQL